MQMCNLCPRKCNVKREEGIYGFCGVPTNPVIAKACLHFGEEPCISGSKGSGTVFFSGCSLKCVFCQNYNISHEKFGKEITVEHLAEIFKNLEKSGAHNINLVTPTHYIPAIKKALLLYKPKVPIVYNSSGYDDISIIEEDIFDIYLFDLKFFSREKSLKYADCDNYFEIASKAIKKAYEIKGNPIYNREGILQKGVCVRHLLLPQATNDAIEIIKWLSENTPEINLSIMSQYIPMYNSDKFPEINRKISKREYQKVIDYCDEKIFSQIYIQELNSATDELIPDFDLSGI